MKDFRSQVEGERPYLMRYASLQLRNRQAAEDAVQDTLVAALAGEAGFAGRSNLRTWLTGILKHKIIDAIRKSAREATLMPAGADRSEFDAPFADPRHWGQAPAAWGNPDPALGEKQFFAPPQGSLARPPPKTSPAPPLPEPH